MSKKQPITAYPIVSGQILASTMIRQRDLSDYKNSVRVGDRVKGSKGSEPIILAKYKHIALTTDGAITWIDLYMFNVRNADCTDTDYTYHQLA